MNKPAAVNAVVEKMASGRVVVQATLPGGADALPPATVLELWQQATPPEGLPREALLRQPGVEPIDMEAELPPPGEMRAAAERAEALASAAEDKARALADAAAEAEAAKQAALQGAAEEREAALKEAAEQQRCAVQLAGRAAAQQVDAAEAQREALEREAERLQAELVRLANEHAGWRESALCAV